MAKCVYKTNNVDKYCVGSLNKKIEILTRSLGEPTSGSYDYDLSFETSKTVWSSIKTVNGLTMFDSTNTEKIVTHIFIIRYYDGLTSQDWIKYSDKNYDIIGAENISESNMYYKIRANLRGDSTVITNRV